MSQTNRNVISAARKRKERDYSHKGSFVSSHNKQQYQHQPPTPRPGEPGSNPGQSNRVLAGYMAYEFLTKGTLFGQRFDPARAEAVPVSAAEPKRRPNQTGPNEPEGVVKSSRAYAEVAQLLKTDGAHIPGIVNPTQLARWIQM